MKLSKVFYRLGSSIEHRERKYGTVVPDDFLKWAKICEHIIMHYNEGRANGYNYDIEYREIWNGMYDSDTMQPLKRYYPFLMFSELYGLKNQIKCECDDNNIYVLGAEADNKNAIMITYYTMDDNASKKMCDTPKFLKTA